MVQVIDLSGFWTCTVTNPDGRTVRGQMQVAFDRGKLRFGAVANHHMPWSDGLIHRFREESHWVGRLTGRNVVAQTTYVMFIMDGFQLRPPGMPWRLHLLVSPDARSMQGQVLNVMNIAGFLVAERPQ